jgi:hypothetical protein
MSASILFSFRPQDVDLEGVHATLAQLCNCTPPSGEHFPGEEPEHREEPEEAAIDQTEQTTTTEADRGSMGDADEAAEGDAAGRAEELLAAALGKSAKYVVGGQCVPGPKELTFTVDSLTVDGLHLSSDVMVCFRTLLLIVITVQIRLSSGKHKPCR